MPVPKFVLAAMLVLIVGVIVLVILIGLKQPDSSTHTASIEFVQVTQVVAPGQDLVIGVNNATLYVPKEAANLPGVISITPRAPNLFADAPEKGWVRSPVVNVEYWNGQGTPYPEVSFTVPVQICFRITSELWQGYTQHPGELQVHYYAEALNPPRWEPLPLTTNPDRFELCGQTNHLSIFALAIKKDTVIPGTNATPTLSFPSPAQSTRQAQSELYEP